MATLQQNLQRPFYIKHLLERLRYGKAATAMRREAAELIEKMNEDSSNLSAQNSAQAMRIDELQAEIGRLRLDAATWWKRCHDLEAENAALKERIAEWQGDWQERAEKAEAENAALRESVAEQKARINALMVGCEDGTTTVIQRMESLDDEVVTLKKNCNILHRALVLIANHGELVPSSTMQVIRAIACTAIRETSTND